MFTVLLPSEQNLPHILNLERKVVLADAVGAAIVLYKDPPVSLLAGIYKGDTFLECWLHLLVITLTPCAARAA